MVAINSGCPQDVFDLVELTTKLKTESIKTVMEETLVKILRVITEDDFAKTVVLLGGRVEEITYLTSLYTQAQKPTGGRRRGGRCGGTILMG